MARELVRVISICLHELHLPTQVCKAVQQDVFSSLADNLNDLHTDDSIHIDTSVEGDAKGADVLAALDQHFQELHDANVVPAESHDTYVDHSSLA